MTSLLTEIAETYDWTDPEGHQDFQCKSARTGFLTLEDKTSKVFVVTEFQGYDLIETLIGDIWPDTYTEVRTVIF